MEAKLPAREIDIMILSSVEPGATVSLPLSHRRIAWAAFSDNAEMVEDSLRPSITATPPKTPFDAVELPQKTSARRSNQCGRALERAAAQPILIQGN
ncbi:MAG TPA: hypothetical protein VE397_04755 [Stellaceae bacterium]|nr:hypothetical protein [Stellaceae bacterium]